MTRSWSAEERERIARELEQQLGPEYLSIKPGAGSHRYLEGHRVINLANEIFGFDGWSCEVKSTTTDFETVSSDGRVSLGICAIVRITLKDGTYREDVGYGVIQNAPSKAQAYEKVRKEAVTDGVKRAFRCFGNAMGNCLYDKQYCENVRAVVRTAPRFDATKLRRPDTEPRNASSVKRLRTEPAGQANENPNFPKNSNTPQNNPVESKPQALPPDQDLNSDYDFEPQIIHDTPPSGNPNPFPNEAQAPETPANSKVSDPPAMFVSAEKAALLLNGSAVPPSAQYDLHHRSPLFKSGIPQDRSTKVYANRQK